MRSVYAADSYPLPSLGGPPAGGVTPIQASHLNEIRTAIRTLHNHCTWTVTPDTRSVGYTTGSTTFQIGTRPGCNWTAQVLAAAVKLTVVAGENLTVGSTVWLPAESMAPGR